MSLVIKIVMAAKQTFMREAGITPDELAAGSVELSFSEKTATLSTAKATSSPSIRSTSWASPTHDLAKLFPAQGLLLRRLWNFDLTAEECRGE